MRTNPAVLAAFLGLAAISCSKDGGKSVSEPEPAVEYTLTVSYGMGVSGAPAPGKYKHAAGAKVFYSLGAMSGYQRLAVEFDDGALGQSAGNIVMTHDVKLFASAEAIPVEIPEAEPVKTAVLEYAQETDSSSVLASYQRYLESLESSYRTNPDRAREIALSGYVKALELLTDADLERTERFLSAQLFGPSPTSGAGGIETGRNTALIFVNGILNSSVKASLGRIELERAVAEAGLSDEVEVYNFYNASAKYENDAVRKCFRHAVERENYLAYRLCSVAGGLEGLTDLAEAARQTADIIGTWPSKAEPEAQALAEVVKEERARGRAVILVGHSQGTLMAAQSLKELGTADPCIRVVSLGAPLGKQSWQSMLSAESLEGFAVAGERVMDIILALGQNDFDRVPTNLTKLADERVKALDNPNLALAYAVVDELFENVKLHSMVDSYMAGTESRARIVTAITRQITSLQGNAECSESAGPRIFATSGNILGGVISAPSDLWAVTVAKKGNDVKIGRIRTIDELEPLITDVALSPSGQLLAVSHDALYSIDTLSGHTDKMADFIGSPVPMFNALAFDNQGRLYATSLDGRIIAMEASNPLKILWQGDLGSLYRSSGDLAFSPDGKLYATVTTNVGFDRLAELDSRDGHVVRHFEPIGYENVWGLSFVGNKLYGFTTNPAKDEGLLIGIDLATGRGSVIRSLGFNAFGSARKSKRF